MTELKPPDSKRVRARALVLAAVSCRGIIEADAGESYAKKLWKLLGEWTRSPLLAGEIEPGEEALLAAPLGTLTRRQAANASWRSEGMVVLAWAIGHAELPDVMTQCDPRSVADRLGLLGGPSGSPVRTRRVTSTRIEAWAATYLTLHWRLREYSLRPVAIDFVTYARECQWGPLRVDHLPITDLDLAIGGERIDAGGKAAFRNALSIATERHQAFNWLLGDAEIYSEVTTDT